MAKPGRYLQKRGHSWYYYRRVPAKFAAFDDRGTVRCALGTSSLDQARLRRDQLAVADDEYWASLALVEAGSVDGQALSRPVAKRRYRYDGRILSGGSTAGCRYPDEFAGLNSLSHR